MRYYSTNNIKEYASLDEAVVRGLAPDNGLYMPESIDQLPASFFQTISEKSFQQIAFEVSNHLLKGEIPEMDLREIVNHTVAFDAPLHQLKDDVFSLELFHGPTMAFKDFGARFMSQLLGYFVKKIDKQITILVATSGDTGSAVANGFLGVKGTNVVILYPSGKVSDIQEKQFTTLGENITALEVNGNFDDCQRMVKLAFLDADLNKRLFLTSANSINIARLIPQSFYYFYAWSRLARKDKVVFSVPSGNYGNLTAGLMAKKMGLPVHHFVASTNTNDIFPKFLEMKKFEPRKSLSTISNAMDVGNPSNFSRILDLYNNDWSKISHEISGYSFSDDDTREIMRKTYLESKYILDPHGAVGLLGLLKYKETNPDVTGIFLETAHPAKFGEVVESTLQIEVALPKQLSRFNNSQKHTIKVANEFDELKNFLLNRSMPA